MIKQNKIIATVWIFVLVLSFQACTVSKTIYGDYNKSNGKSYTHSKSKEVYLFWELIQLQSSDKNIGTKNYIKTIKRNGFDGLITYGTMGIFSFYTVKIEVQKQVNEAPPK